MNKYKLTYLALLSVLSAGFADLHAQESEVFELEDYEVVGKYLQTDQINALKTPTPVEDIPQSLTILTSDLVELQDLTGMADIADYVTGIDAGQGEGHRDDILFRGVKSTADFFVDGVRDDVQYFRPLYNVEQVEVLKGANAIFFGRGGTGGLINRVSKKAQLGEDFTTYALSLDDLGERSLQIDSNMAIAPNMALRLNYYTEDLENHRDFYYGDNSGINPTFTYELSDKTTVTASYENLDHERFIDRGIPSENGIPVESLAGITFGSKDDNLSSLDADIIKLVVDHQLDESTKLRLNYTDNEFSKMYQNLYASSYNSTNDTVDLGGYRDTTDRSSKILSLDLIGEKEISGLTHKYVLGYEKIDTSNDNTRYYMDTSGVAMDNGNSNLEKLQKGESLEDIAITDPLVLGSYNFTTELFDDTEAELDVSSIYFSDEVALSDNLDLVIGGRLDTYEVDVIANAGTHPNVTSASKKDEEFSPRLGFVYNPEEDVTYYLSYSESFLPASGDQYADLNQSKNSDTLGPDVFENTEIGVKFDLDNGISITTALYELNSKLPKGSQQDGTYAVVEDETKGIEIQAVGNVTENWFISAGLNKIRGDVPDEVAEKSASIWNLYSVDSKLSFGLGIVHKGKTVGKGSTELPAYTRIDAAAYYKIDDNMRVQLNVENVTDELYFPNSYGSGQVTVGAPMHATIKIVGRF
jgi:catecholate siderophore receptor